MNHQEIGANLEPFLDGSLGAVERWAVIAHMDECAACRRHVAGEARLRERLREQLLATDPPPGLGRRVQDALAAALDLPATISPLPFSPGIRTRLAIVIGPALAAIWLLAQVATAPVGASLDIPREVAATHALFAQEESLLDVFGESAAVSAWFRDTVGLAVDPPVIAGYSLMGGRLIVLNGWPVAQLIYESEDERYLSLLACRGYSMPGPLTLSHRGAIATATWPVADDWVALAGELPDAAMMDLVKDLDGWPARNSSAPASNRYEYD